MPYASLFPAHRRGQGAGIEQREVDVDRALRGITQIERAFGSGGHGQREQEVAVRDVTRAEGTAVAGGVLPPGEIRQGLVQIQRIDQRIVLSQVDESRLVSVIAQGQANPPRGRRETHVGRGGRRGDKSRTQRAADSPWRCRACPHDPPAAPPPSSSTARARIRRETASWRRERPQRAGHAALTNTAASNPEIFATRLRPYTIAILSSVVCLEYATDSAGSNAMRRLLKAALRIGVFAVVVAVGLFLWFVAWPVHTVPALEQVDEYVWLDQGWGDGAELRVAAALLLHRAGNFDAARRLGRRSALRLVRESRTAAVTRALCGSRAHAQVPISRGSGAEPRQPASVCRSDSRAISMRRSAKTCSTSPALPATRANSTTPRMAARARSASTAARRCMRSPT